MPPPPPPHSGAAFASGPGVSQPSGVVSSSGTVPLQAGSIPSQFSPSTSFMGVLGIGTIPQFSPSQFSPFPYSPFTGTSFQGVPTTPLDTAAASGTDQTPIPGTPTPRGP